MSEGRRPITVGIAGGTGSGKTTVAEAILERVGREQIVYICHDAYYKNLEDLPVTEGLVNFDHPNSLDTPLLVQHIQQLQAGQSVGIPIYNYFHARAEETLRINPHPIILVDGILLLAEPELRKLFDIKIFVDTDADVRFIRRLQRDISERGRTVDYVIKQYLVTIRPGHLEFVESSKRYADIIIPEGGLNPVAVDMVADRIRTMLQAQR